MARRRSRVRVRLPSLAAIAVLVVLIGPAVADPTAARLFREGRRLMRAGQVAEACARFADSQRLDPSVGTLLNLGDCRERMGQLATAWTTFEAARALAVQRRDRRATEAGSRASQLAPRLSFLTLVVPSAPARLTLVRAGVPVDPTAWNQPEPIDPGTYTIEARAPGHRPWSTSVHIVGGQRAQIVVELEPEVQRLVVTRPDPMGPVPTPADRAPAAVGLGATSRRRPVPVRSAGLGLAVGANHREVPLIGARATAGIPLPGGALRGTATVLYSRHEDATLDPVERTATISIGLGGDYVWMPLPQLAFAAGLGIGFDRDEVRQASMVTTDVGAWFMVHASPVLVRVLDGRLEVGLHAQLARAADEWTLIGLASMDVFMR